MSMASPQARHGAGAGAGGASFGDGAVPLLNMAGGQRRSSSMTLPSVRSYQLGERARPLRPDAKELASLMRKSGLEPLDMEWSSSSDDE